MPAPASLDTQLAALRERVRRERSTVARPDELREICGDDASAVYQFTRIAEIAIMESWSFEFLQDGSVVFADLGYAD
ncbi:MAG: hypothetical protein ACJ8KU_04470 [Chthoniobacterales bacterium]